MIPAHLRRNDPTLTADLAAYRLSPNKAERQEKMLTTNSELAEMKQLHAALMETPTQGTKRVNVVMARDVAPPSKVARLTGILLAEAQAVNPAYPRHPRLAQQDSRSPPGNGVRRQQVYRLCRRARGDIQEPQLSVALHHSVRCSSYDDRQARRAETRSFQA